MSLLLQAKRSVNMGFRSKRSLSGTSSFVNHLPAFTQEHTYASQPLSIPMPRSLTANGLIRRVRVTAPRGSTLGGRYGMGLKLNFACAFYPPKRQRR